MDFGYFFVILQSHFDNSNILNKTNYGFIKSNCSAC
jgi:hypothetical protein